MATQFYIKKSCHYKNQPLNRWLDFLVCGDLLSASAGYHLVLHRKSLNLPTSVTGLCIIRRRCIDLRLLISAVIVGTAALNESWNLDFLSFINPFWTRGTPLLMEGTGQSQGLSIHKTAQQRWRKVDKFVPWVGFHPMIPRFPHLKPRGYTSFLLM